MTNLSTREIIDNIYNGKTALRWQYPKAGETPYYYLNPNRKNFYSTPAPEDIANVNSPDDPNPFLQPQKQSELSVTSSTIGSVGLNDTTNTNNGLFGETDNSDTTTDSLWNNQTNDTTGDIWNTKDSYWNTTSTFNNDSLSRNNNLYSSSYTSPFSSTDYQSDVSTTFPFNYSTNSSGMNNNSLTSTQQLNSTRNRKPFTESVLSSLKHDFDDTMYGAKRALSGMTFGGSDWLLKQAGITDDAYLAERDAEGLGTTTRAAGLAAEIGGNAIGLGGAVLKGVGKLGLSGVQQAGVAGGIEGLAYGVTGSNNLTELPENMLLGASTGILVPYAFNYATKPLSTIWNKGIETLPHLQNLFEYKNGLNNYLKTQSGYHRTNTIPTKEQLHAYKPDSSFNPNSYSKKEAENLLRVQANQQPIKIFNDHLSHLENEVSGINHFTRSDRRPFVRTLNTTLENPDLTFSRAGRDYAIKKYKNLKTGEDFFDYIIKEKGKLFDKYPVKEKYVYGKIKESPTQNLSLRGVRPDIFKPTSGMDGLKNNVANRNAFVKNLKRNISTEKQAIKDIWIPSVVNRQNNSFSKQSMTPDINSFLLYGTTIPPVLEVTNR